MSKEEGSWKEKLRKKKGGWQLGAAVFKGMIYSVGAEFYALDLFRSEKPYKFPLPSPDQYPGSFEMIVVAVADPRDDNDHQVDKATVFIYGAGCGTGNAVGALFSFDTITHDWNVLDDSLFVSNLAPGVVLRYVGFSYLFSFAVHHPNHLWEGAPSIYVFDIVGREWLPEPVEGLEEIHPNIKDGIFCEDLFFRFTIRSFLY